MLRGPGRLRNLLKRRLLIRLDAAGLERTGYQSRLLNVPLEGASKRGVKGKSAASVSCDHTSGFTASDATAIVKRGCK